MLILSRRIGESLFIGDDVRLTVLGEQGGRVRIGVSAPRAVAVWREEVYERVRAEPSSPSARRLESVEYETE